MSRRAVIIVAGGTGTRMKNKLAKQFIPLAGKPIILHTIEAFRQYDPDIEIVIVLHESLFEEWNALLKTENYTADLTLVAGGEERFHSVKLGLAALRSNVELVAVHDAVRPLVSKSTIQAAFEMAALSGAAIPVVPVTDTIRQNLGNKTKTIPRHTLSAVQTPQCFSFTLLRQAYEIPYRAVYTDDASVVEQAGHLISLVPGNRTNVKITTPEDLYIAEALLEAIKKPKTA